MLLTNVVVLGLPLKFTTDPEKKPEPFTVSVNAAEPATTPVGAIVLTTGARLFTVNVTAVDVPPPGVGLVTVTGGVPAVAISLAKITAVNDVALTNVVALGLLLKFTVEEETNPVPVTVSVNCAPPALAADGDSKVTDGAGLVAELTAKLTAADVPPPAGFVTVTGAVTGDATSVAKIEAVSCDAFTNVVVLALPLKFTTAPVTKPVPLTVKINAAEPDVVPVGDNEVMVGAVLVTVTTVAVDVDVR
jgi:hypothetical protein